MSGEDPTNVPTSSGCTRRSLIKPFPQAENGTIILTCLVCETCSTLQELKNGELLVM